MQIGANPTAKMNRFIVHIPSILSRRPTNKSYLNLSCNCYMGFGLACVGVVYWLSVCYFFGVYHPAWCEEHKVQDCFSMSRWVYIFHTLVLVIALYLTIRITISDAGYLTAGERSDYREMYAAHSSHGHSEDGLPTPLSVIRCGYCNVFVHGYDHHCHIMGACVGKKNMGMFLAFLAADLFLALCLFINYIVFVVASLRSTSESAFASFSAAFPSWPATNIESMLKFFWQLFGTMSPITWDERGLSLMGTPNVTIPIGGLLLGTYLTIYTTGILAVYFRLALTGMETVEVRFLAKVASAKQSSRVILENDKSADQKDMDRLLATAPPSSWLFKANPPVRNTVKQVILMMQAGVANSRIFWSTADGEPAL